MNDVSPYPKHCFDATGASQTDDTYECCWCGVEPEEYAKSVHGPRYKGAGAHVSHRGEDCPVRRRDDARGQREAALRSRAHYGLEER